MEILRWQEACRFGFTVDNRLCGFLAGILCTMMLINALPILACRLIVNALDSK
jgi:hypothetical protein